jgi:hypothetical protein
MPHPSYGLKLARIPPEPEPEFRIWFYSCFGLNWTCGRNGPDPSRACSQANGLIPEPDRRQARNAWSVALIGGMPIAHPFCMSDALQALAGS